MYGITKTQGTAVLYIIRRTEQALHHTSP